MNVHQEVEFLREENRQLRESLVGAEFAFPAEWRLTRAEQLLLNSLYTGPNFFRGEEALRFASCRGNATDRDVVKVRVCGMRKKLKPAGIEIKTVWGEGYELTPGSAAIIKGVLA